MVAESLKSSGSDSGDELKTTKGNVKVEGDVETTDNLQKDIENALAEVASGLESLKMQQAVSSSTEPQRTVIGHPKHTPDLVLDLPISTESPSPKDGSEPDSPTLLSTADVFAESNQCTMKKACSMPRGVGSNSLRTFDHQAVKRSVSTNATVKNRAKLEQVLQKQRAQMLDPEIKPHVPSRVPPPIATKPKPSLKMKPQVLPKPERSPELMRKLAEREARINNGNSSDAAK